MRAGIKLVLRCRGINNGDRPEREVRSGGWYKISTATLGFYSSYFLKIREPFVPPNPNELLSTVLIDAFLASCGT